MVLLRSSDFRNGFASTSMYERRAATIKEDLFFCNGPSTDKRLNTLPIPPFTWYFWLLPSFIRISRTEEVRPPYSAGKALLYMVTFFTASGLNTEKKPSRCEELYTGASSIIMRFSSTL